MASAIGLSMRERVRIWRERTRFVYAAKPTVYTMASFARITSVTFEPTSDANDFPSANWTAASVLFAVIRFDASTPRLLAPLAPIRTDPPGARRSTLIVSVGPVTLIGTVVATPVPETPPKPSRRSVASPIDELRGPL